MRDPREGLAPDGTIRTGAHRSRVPSVFEPVLTEAVAAFGEVAGSTSSLLLYGSVATGTAQAGQSDVDLVAVEAPRDWCRDTGRDLTKRFTDLCRGVEIGHARRADSIGDEDESYGNRVFLRHYCVHLAGVDVAVSWAPFPGDARAARGFNGDIGHCLEQWRAQLPRARAVARKTLLAASGVVSIQDGTWTTDRGTAARRWAEHEPTDAESCAQLLRWVDDDSTATRAELEAALAPGGIVYRVTERFERTIGLWR